MKLINCYKGFEENYKKDFTNKQLQAYWYSFMDQFGILRDMCIDDYKNEGYEWQELSINKVFNYSEEYVNRMTRTSQMIESIIVSMKGKLNSFFKLETDDITIIIYHGLGNAAGWVTKYKGKPAIYLGLEKIVELEWNSKEKLEDLISHEYGHLIHMKVRNESLDPYTDFTRKMIYRIYTEGLATYCEKIFNGRHISSPKWFKKAESLEGQLRKEFLYRLDNKLETCHDFFGDWYPVLGLNEAGYFLGLAIIEGLVKIMSILDVMTLDYKTIECYVIKYLQKGD